MEIFSKKLIQLCIEKGLSISIAESCTGGMIISKAISGPFKSLDSSWHFKNIDKKQCRVDFMIEYQFKSFFLDKVMGSLFKKATIKMLDAFELRAKSLHN